MIVDTSKQSVKNSCPPADGDPIVAAARELRSRGFAITFLDPGEKNLRRSGWTLASQEVGDYRPGCNLGLMTGRLSGDLVCIDCDSPQAIEVADKFLPDTSMIEGRPGKPRSHRYYRVTNIPSALTAKDNVAGGLGGPCIKHFGGKGKGSGVLDILGTGAQAVCPPSLHSSGEVREWEGGAMGEPSTVDCGELYAAAERLAVACGWKPKAKTTKAPRSASPARLDVIKRALQYLAKVPGAVSGCVGHSQMFDAARCICWGFDLGADVGFDLLLANYNPRCEPPWSESELRHKCRDADTVDYDKPRGWLLDNGQANRNGDGHRDHHDDDGPHDDDHGDAWEGDEPPMDPPTENAAPPIPELKPIEAPDDPHRLARGFIKEKCQHRDGVTMRFWCEEWHYWDGSFWRRIPAKELNARLTASAKNALDRLNVESQKLTPSGKAPPLAKKVTARLITDTANALASLTILPGRINQPSWLTANPPFPADETLACRNGLIHLPSLVADKDYFAKPTPRFFSPMCLDFDFSTRAPKPAAWWDFLAKLWPKDEQSIATLQEFFGYLLTADTTQQKILMLVGPLRSGKGTISRVIRALIGPANVVNPTLSGLATNFGLWPLLGKTCAIISDARLGTRSDVATVTERLLSISGEDAQTIDRKNLPPITTKLLVRFAILTNELPKLGDSSGALPGRMILLRLTESWFGREDHKLTEKLLAELPGILLWAIDGWRRLRERGYFVQPDSSKDLISDLGDLSSPIGAFVRDRCQVKAGCHIERSILFNAWKDWCAEQGRDHPGDSGVFGRNLHAAVPTISGAQPRTDTGERIRVYEGICLK